MYEVNGSMEDVFKTEETEAPQQTTQPTQEKQETQQTDTGAFKWSQYGLDTRYDTLKQEQIAREFAHNNKVLGRQAQELGEARKKMQEYEAKMSEFQRVAGQTPQQVTDGWDEIKTQHFMKLIDEGKIPQAMDLALAEKLKPKYEGDDFQKAVDARVQEHLQKFYGWQQEQAIASDPDYPQFAEYIATLRDKEYLGEDRNPKDLLALSKLVVENKQLADLTFMGMKQHPSMTFDDAKNYALYKLNAQQASESKKAEFKSTVDNLNGVGKPKSTSQNTASGQQFKTMDEAFAAD